jgi:hypothetical protein
MRRKVEYSLFGRIRNGQGSSRREVRVVKENWIQTCPISETSLSTRRKMNFKVTL